MESNAKSMIMKQNSGPLQLSNAKKQSSQGRPPSRAKLKSWAVGAGPRIGKDLAGPPLQSQSACIRHQCKYQRGMEIQQLEHCSPCSAFGRDLGNFGPVGEGKDLSAFYNKGVSSAFCNKGVSSSFPNSFPRT
jgi:hypothetical protein